LGGFLLLKLRLGARLQVGAVDFDGHATHNLPKGQHDAKLVILAQKHALTTSKRPHPYAHPFANHEIRMWLRFAEMKTFAKPLNVFIGNRYRLSSAAHQGVDARHFQHLDSILE
jgi:hypothetical protein